MIQLLENVFHRTHPAGGGSPVSVKERGAPGCDASRGDLPVSTSDGAPEQSRCSGYLRRNEFGGGASDRLVCWRQRLARVEYHREAEVWEPSAWVLVDSIEENPWI
jgi:hypothetical protein